MGAIRDVVDLLTQLIDSVKDRKFATELLQIQSMISGIQSEQADLHDKNIALTTENAELKKSIASLQQEIANAQIAQSPSTDKLSEEQVKILVFLTQSKSPVVAQVAQGTGIDMIRTEYWLRELLEKELLHHAIFAGAPSKYYLSQGGKEYLIKNKLI